MPGPTALLVSFAQLAPIHQEWLLPVRTALQAPISVDWVPPLVLCVAWAPTPQPLLQQHVRTAPLAPTSLALALQLQATAACVPLGSTLPAALLSARTALLARTPRRAAAAVLCVWWGHTAVSLGSPAARTALQARTSVALEAPCAALAGLAPILLPTAQPHVRTAALGGTPQPLVLPCVQLVPLEAMLLPMALSHVRTALLVLILPPTVHPRVRTAALDGMPLLLV